MTAVSAILAFGVFVAVSHWRVFSLVIAALGLACAFIGPRLRFPWPVLAGVAAVAGIPTALLSGSYFEKTFFLSDFALATAVALAACQCLLLVRIHPPREQLVVDSFPICFSMASMLSFGLPLLPAAAVAAVQVTLLSVALRSRTGLVFSWLAVGTFVPAFALAAGMAMLMQWSETKTNFLWALLQPNIPMNVSFSFQNRSEIGSMPQDSPLVVLRIFAANPPEYLVGMCYCDYSDGVWTAPNGSRPLPPAASYKFWLSTRHVELNEFDTFESGPERTLMLPRDGMRLLVGTPQADAHFGHSVSVRGGWIQAGIYQVGRVLNEVMPAEGDAEEAPLCLGLPSGLDPVVAQLAQSVTAHCKNDVDRANVLTNYLQDNFQYGHEFSFSPGTDVVGEFLKHRPKAHCEVFATTLVLMLRTLHIPARYVNGFVVRERNTATRVDPRLDKEGRSGRYSTVRVRDAHAWTEAWLGGRWVRLDPTPPAELAPPTDAGTFLDRFLEWVRSTTHRLLNMSPREAFAALVEVLRHAGPWAIVAGAVYLLFRYARRLWLERDCSRSSGAARVPLEAMPLLLARFEEAAALSALRREPQLTLGAWARRLAPSAAEFVAEYSRLRYGRSALEPEEMASLQAACERAITELRTLREAARLEGLPPRR